MSVDLDLLRGLVRRRRVGAYRLVWRSREAAQKGAALWLSLLDDLEHERRERARLQAEFDDVTGFDQVCEQLGLRRRDGGDIDALAEATREMRAADVELTQILPVIHDDGRRM